MRRNPIRNTKCKNCQNDLEIKDSFCSLCGQENHYITHSIKEIWDDFVSNYTNFDTKVLKTFKTIIKHPGKISVEYIAGKKARYVSPFRLYFFISVVFFFVFSQVNESDYNGSELHQFCHNRFVIDKYMVREMEQFDSMHDRIKYLRDNKEVKKKK